jgi:hypothetical protein
MKAKQSLYFTSLFKRRHGEIQHMFNGLNLSVERRGLSKILEENLG